MTLAICTVEGVLAQGSDLKTAPSTKWAKPLYDGMRSQFHVALLTSSDQDIARWWLKKERISQWSALITWPREAFDYPHWRLDHVRSLLAAGWEVAFFLDTDMELLHEVSSLGVMTLSVSYPDKPPGWRDTATSSPRPWSRVVDTVEAGG